MEMERHEECLSPSFTIVFGKLHTFIFYFFLYLLSFRKTLVDDFLKPQPQRAFHCKGKRKTSKKTQRPKKTPKKEGESSKQTQN